MVPTIKYVSELYEPNYQESLLYNRGIFGQIFMISNGLESGNPNKLVIEFNNYLVNILDTEYYYNHSGDKLVSPIVNKIAIRDNLDITKVIGGGVRSAVVTLNAKLAQIIINKFGRKWNRLYQALIENNYTLDENVNMNESGNNKTNVKGKVTTTSSQNNNVYPFDSSEYVPKSSQQSDSTTEGMSNDNEHLGSSTFTRHGRDGLKTSQELIEEEIRLRNEQNFYNIMYDDIDSVIALDVYESEVNYYDY